MFRHFAVPVSLGCAANRDLCAILNFRLGIFYFHFFYCETMKSLQLIFLINKSCSLLTQFFFSLIGALTATMTERTASRTSRDRQNKGTSAIKTGRTVGKVVVGLAG
jgi:K+-sensing histidine kinase KdpD